MLTIRYLGQTAERLMHNLHAGTGNGRGTVFAAERCADYIEHIAQYDFEGLPEQSRMVSIARALEWLREVRSNFDGEFSPMGPQTPSIADINALYTLSQKTGSNT